MAYLMIFIPLIFTLIIEGLVMWKLTHNKRWIFYSIIINTFTNPILNLSIPVVLDISFYTDMYMYVFIATLLLEEVIVIIVEAVLYYLMDGEPFKVCFYRSFIANAISVVIGFILMVLLGLLTFCIINRRYLLRLLHSLTLTCLADTFK